MLLSPRSKGEGKRGGAREGPSPVGSKATEPFAHAVRRAMSCHVMAIADGLAPCYLTVDRFRGRGRRCRGHEPCQRTPTVVVVTKNGNLVGFVSTTVLY